nr:hypothetical protein [uncultured Roseovarius sp.]
MTQRDDGSVPRMTLSVAGTLWQAEPGALAALRRMADSSGAPLFWRLSARHGWQGRALTDWAAIARMLARLTPTGERPRDKSLHDPARPFGAVLCDGGDRDWGGERPMLSEARLARLLAARGDQRRIALERAVRMLARNHPQFNLPDLAWVVLTRQGGARIARDYYARLDRAAATTKDDAHA